MVADTTLQEAIIAVGHIGATTAEMLIDALALFSIKSNLREFEPSNVPPVCIIRSSESEIAAHWTLRCGDFEYNPHLMAPVTFSLVNFQSAQSLVEVVTQ